MQRPTRLLNTDLIFTILWMTFDPWQTKSKRQYLNWFFTSQKSQRNSHWNPECYSLENIVWHREDFHDKRWVAKYSIFRPFSFTALVCQGQNNMQLFNPEWAWRSKALSGIGRTALVAVGNGLSPLNLLIRCFFTFLICTSHRHLTLLNSSQSETQDVEASSLFIPSPQWDVPHQHPGRISWKRSRAEWNKGGGKSPSDGVQIASQARSLLCRGSLFATEAFHFVVIANCNSPRHMISPDDNCGSRRGSRNLLFALK